MGPFLVLTSSYPAHAGDYRGIFVKHFADSLERRGHEIEVLTLKTRDASVFRGDGLINELKRRPWRITEVLEAGLRARTELINGDHSVVIAHWLLPFGLLAAHSRAEHGRPVWIVCHSGGVHVFASLPMPIRRWIGGVLVAGCDLLSFVTPGLRRRFLKAVGPHSDRLASRCRILPMGVNAQAFETVEPNPEGPIAVVARLTRLKGIDRLLRAAPRGSRLRLIGDGPERARLIRLGRKLGLELQSLGEVEPCRIPQLLDGCALAAIPSRRLRTGRSEGLPTFALEALAAGLPLLTTTTWDMPANLIRLNGVFRVADSIDGLSVGLERGLAYARVRSPEDEAARRAAARTFDWQRIGERAESNILSL